MSVIVQNSEQALHTLLFQILELFWSVHSVMAQINR